MTNEENNGLVLLETLCYLPLTYWSAVEIGQRHCVLLNYIKAPPLLSFLR